MSKSSWLGLIIVVAIIATAAYLLLRGNFSYSPNTVVPAERPTMTAKQLSGTVQPTKTAFLINIKNFSFQPASATVSAGTTIIWVNRDKVSHTVTSNSGIFNSNSISPGGSFSFTFDRPGIYPYHCSIHPFMLGKITVKE